MSKSEGHWIENALAIDRQLRGQPKHARAAALSREADRLGLKLTTLRRMIPFAHYVAQCAKSAGLALQEVKASAMAVEALMRLESREPLLAASIARDVLSGAMSTRAVLAALKKEPKALPPQPESHHDWFGLAEEIVLQHADGAASFQFNLQRDPYSRTARLLKVDLEISLTQDTRDIAVFLSPQCEFSEFRGKSFYEQVPFIFAALCFYDRVLIGTMEDDEDAIVKNMTDLQRPAVSSAPQRFNLYALYRKPNED